MSNNPVIIDSETLASSALSIMNENKISQIVVTDKTIILVLFIYIIS